MMPETTQTRNATGQTLTITRTFDAPRDLVFEAFTDCRHLVHWWGHTGSSLSHCDLDLRPGGRMHYCIKSPDGSEMWGKLVYREIEEPERLTYVVSFSNEKEEITRNPFSADWPLEVYSENIFTEEDGKTTLTIHTVPVNATDTELAAFAAGREGMTWGTNGMLDVLEEYLAKG